MENNSTPEKKWYDKTWLVVLLCLFFFPLGIYALWKNSSISKGWKIGLTVILILLVIAGLSDDDNSTPSSNTTSTTQQRISTPSEADTRSEKARTEKKQLIEKLKAKAKRDWPNDYTTQEFWINQQIDDYEYMLTIEDNEIKRRAQRDWPLDFTTQKFWYNEQIEARERLK